MTKEQLLERYSYHSNNSGNSDDPAISHEIALIKLQEEILEEVEEKFQFEEDCKRIELDYLISCKFNDVEANKVIKEIVFKMWQHQERK